MSKEDPREDERGVPLPAKLPKMLTRFDVCPVELTGCGASVEDLSGLKLTPNTPVYCCPNHGCGKCLAMFWSREGQSDTLYLGQRMTWEPPKGTLQLYDGMIMALHPQDKKVTGKYLNLGSSYNNFTERAAMDKVTPQGQKHIIYKERKRKAPARYDADGGAAARPRKELQPPQPEPAASLVPAVVPDALGGLPDSKGGKGLPGAALPKLSGGSSDLHPATRPLAEAPSAPSTFNLGGAPAAEAESKGLGKRRVKEASKKAGFRKYGMESIREFMDGLDRPASYAPVAEPKAPTDDELEGLAAAAAAASADAISPRAPAWSSGGGSSSTFLLSGPSSRSDGSTLEKAAAAAAAAADAGLHVGFVDRSATSSLPLAMGGEKAQRAGTAVRESRAERGSPAPDEEASFAALQPFVSLEIPEIESSLRGGTMKAGKPGLPAASLSDEDSSSEGAQGDDTIIIIDL